MFSIQSPNLNLEQIYKSGQCYRWFRPFDGTFIIMDGENIVCARQKKNRLLFTCDEGTFCEKWFEYFDLGFDYSKLNHKSRQLDNFIKVCSVRGNGVRILKQDLFECIITNIIANNNTIVKTKGLIDILCKGCGVRKRVSVFDSGPFKWYTFPTHTSLMLKINKLKDCRIDHIRKPIVDICKLITEREFDLQYLSTLSYEEAKWYMLDFDMFNEDIAENICLYGLHHYEASPVSQTLFNIFAREYDAEYEESVLWPYSRADRYKGIIQQYMIYNELNPPLEV